MKHIVPEQKRIFLPIVDSDQLFPVGRVYCVGRNYAEHSKEMGDDPERDPPFFFAKDASNVVPALFSATTHIAYPMATSQFEYEVELVVAIGKGGRHLTLEQASEAILGYAVGLDMTRRDLQAQAKKKGRPWEVGKSFDESAPVSPILLKNNQLSAVVLKAEIGLKVNGEMKQVSHISNLTWSIEEVICKLSDVFELRPGDLIMTGTPENVGAVQAGDEIVAWVEHLGEIRVCVTD
ncbi:fumarylacetoacetate hydrolase family protein [Marinomonas sp. M1K-6]|uniref:Fumarylacetoacetate hydrolase family protein n=1 Tax=Marinomonas profundi TaxID=2726122 RepID=A0A847RCU5_9GAMM|nr:fumarylacetoacetate hydrolase family protein [Marinomonas profundi]NLQ19147.1 fumarylacetoacetate hydrolase family protein [Marinomonas profundi]UDV02046.1 fumarylacetoacetate hydrolase family protein [Marinomonas profundi]